MLHLGLNNAMLINEINVNIIQIVRKNIRTCVPAVYT